MRVGLSLAAAAAAVELGGGARGGVRSCLRAVQLRMDTGFDRMMYFGGKVAEVENFPSTNTLPQLAFLIPF